ncbi:hypothetical protein J1N35_028960 [Gossypium stocksii]|uniref:RNase H type-1 domain-containing protein n=1 Tax=Gossypium stocksii TaxID=47602 RepID=A0A9D3UXA3_9ROSI|nr:hypothetical protein J1N35_028960 [Gossypium stocksii]
MLNSFCEDSDYKINAYKTNVCFSKGVDDALAENLCNILSGGRKFALVSWDNVCQPREHDGLGLQKLQDHNTSFMMKLGFQIATNSKSLWALVVRTKYGIPSGMLETISQGRCSILWKALANTWSLIKVNLIWPVGDERKIRCWHDSWIPKIGVLANLILGLSSLSMDCLLSDMVLGDGRWNLDLFRISLPEEKLCDSQDSNLWLHVECNWVCLYTDGPVQNDGSFAAAEGITNSRDGKWILGYNRYLGICSVFDVELWGILDGLALLFD